MKKIFELNRWNIASFDNTNVDYSTIENHTEWMSVDKTADIHTYLIEKGIIEDPAFAQNDIRQVWVEKKAWVYKTEVTLFDDLARYKTIDLEALGIDTYATIYVNGIRIANTENMFVSYRFCVKDVLHTGSNEIVIVFPVLNSVAQTEKLPVGFWTNYSTERAFSRKASYSFGWDWSPRVATIGLWKPMQIVFHDNPIIENVTVKTELHGYSKCKINLDVTFDDPMLKNIDYHVKIITPKQEILEYNSKDTIVIDQPLLWTVHDQGEQNLYNIQVFAFDCMYETSFGIRKIELLTKSEEGENLFLFRINGENVFCRGANWVPVSNRPGNAAVDYYKKLIKMTVQAGMNTLVLWGGGIYEPEIFYDLCDANGIVVLQYFMFACGEYPDWDEKFITNVKTEVFQQVKRLDNHPSVIMYIGNVENTMLSQKIGLQREVYGNTLFFELIPSWLKELGSDRFYQPTSPYGGELANSEEYGDRHNWDVWFTDLPYYAYAKDKTLFASEFGLHATPVYESVLAYCGKENLQLGDFEFTYLNRDHDANRMLYYINTHIGTPKTVKEYCNMSMMVQAEALKFACEHYRRRFPKCAGATIWQLNDCCGVQSWSIIDYDLIPKASYYYLKKAFTSVNVNIRYDSANESTIFICNNSNTDIERTVRITVSDFFGNIAHEETLFCHVQRGCVSEIKHIAVGGRFYPNVIIGNRICYYYLSAEIVEESLTAVRLFDDVKNLTFPLSSVAVKVESDALVFHADCYTKFVHLSGKMQDVELEDNYFDLLPGKSMRVKFKTNYEGKRDYQLASWNSPEFTISF